MFWKNARNSYGYCSEEKVQVYECSFTAECEGKDKLVRKSNLRCLVVSNTVEEAIFACRHRWPRGFVLHQIVKKNQACDLIVTESVLSLAEQSN